jgi:PucR-like helix-turn-helix protein/diguanylate cyclase with GGDEF domain
MPPTAELEAVVQQHLTELVNATPPTELGVEMGDYLIASIPEFAELTDDYFREGIIRSCISNLTAMWGHLRGDPLYVDIVPPADAIAWAHELVHRGMKLAALLRAYRMGHGLVETRFAQVAAKLIIDAEVRWLVLAEATRFNFAYIDTVCTRLVEDYEEERARWIRGAAAARAELVSAIIDGHDVAPDEATSRLHYGVHGRHLAFIVWRETGPVAEQWAAPLEVTATALARELGGGQVLLIPIGERVVWAWTSSDNLIASPPARPKALASGARAAVGTQHEHVVGMGASHHEARAARRVAELFGSRPGALVRYESVAVTSLQCADPAHAARFTERVLGDLAEDTDQMARLRETARAYLEANLSPRNTARQLDIHQNTVVYRIRKVEEIIGRPIEAYRVELEVALRLVGGLQGLRAASERRPTLRELLQPMS